MKELISKLPNQVILDIIDVEGQDASCRESLEEALTDFLSEYGATVEEGEFGSELTLVRESDGFKFAHLYKDDDVWSFKWSNQEKKERLFDFLGANVMNVLSSIPEKSEIRVGTCKEHGKEVRILVTYDNEGTDMQVEGSCGCWEEGSHPIYSFVM